MTRNEHAISIADQLRQAINPLARHVHAESAALGVVKLELHPGDAAVLLTILKRVIR